MNVLFFLQGKKVKTSLRLNFDDALCTENPFADSFSHFWQLSKTKHCYTNIKLKFPRQIQFTNNGTFFEL